MGRIKIEGPKFTSSPVEMLTIAGIAVAGLALATLALENNPSGTVDVQTKLITGAIGLLGLASMFFGLSRKR